MSAGKKNGFLVINSHVSTTIGLVWRYYALWLHLYLFVNFSMLIFFYFYFHFALALAAQIKRSTKLQYIRRDSITNDHFVCQLFCRDVWCGGLFSHRIYLCYIYRLNITEKETMDAYTLHTYISTHQMHHCNQKKKNQWHTTAMHSYLYEND